MTRNRGRGPQQKLLGTPLQGGFTLIELLVVVLIIGILSAVALPQYNKAVEKSRAAEGLLALKSLSDAAAVYYLDTGAYTDIGLDKLPIQVPAQGEFFTFDAAVYFPYHMDMLAQRKSGDYFLVAVLYHGKRLRVYCHTSTKTDICNALGAKNCAPNTECVLE